jgi:hypothetical protein
MRIWPSLEGAPMTVTVTGVAQAVATSRAHQHIVDPPRGTTGDAPHVLVSERTPRRSGDRGDDRVAVDR